MENKSKSLFDFFRKYSIFLKTFKFSFFFEKNLKIIFIRNFKYSFFIQIFEIL